MRSVLRQLVSSCASSPLLGRGIGLTVFLLGLASCATESGIPQYAVKDGVVVSVKDQKMAVVKNGKAVKTYKVSTSKFGHGDTNGSNHTPLGWLTVSDKIGGNQPSGMVFKKRKPTGEILQPNAPGRDPIVSRIIWLAGNEKHNKNAKPRCIYIHGTPEEKKLGRPASYGCVRMRSRDVIELYNVVDRGTPVVIEKCSLSRSLEFINFVYNAPAASRMQLTSSRGKGSAKSNS